MTALYDKTDKGRDEIATRKYHLSARLRSLLLVIDGKHDTDVILEKFRGIGLHETSLQELVDQGFIERIKAAMPVPEAAKAALPAAAEPVPEAAHPFASEEQYKALYQFFSETIKSTIGLRGYALQLKVERAGSVEEFRALREPYLAAVAKAKGNELARSLGARLDGLLNGTLSPSQSAPSVQTQSAPSAPLAGRIIPAPAT